jgi:hypothetical protein
MKTFGPSVNERRRTTASGPPDNGRIASLLKVESDIARGSLVLAFKRASRRALIWSEKASDLVATNRSQTELQGIGPHLSELIEGWIKSPPPVDIPSQLQDEFMTMAEATRVLAVNPQWERIFKAIFICTRAGAMVPRPSRRWPPQR